MDIQVLPNWFKKIALIVFIITSIISGGDDFSNGFNSGYYDYNQFQEESQREVTLIADFFGGEQVMHWFHVISVLSILTYMIAKEKVEDDYIKLLRLESYQLAFIIIVLVSFVINIFSVEFKYGLSDTLSLFLWLYLIVFYIKKRLN